MPNGWAFADLELRSPWKEWEKVKSRTSPAQRISLEIPVDMSFEGSTIGTEGILRNLSETGALIRTSQMGLPGTRVQLDFRAFRASAYIIWGSEEEAGSFLVGVRFTQFERQDQGVVRGFVQFLGNKGDFVGQSLEPLSRP